MNGSSMVQRLLEFYMNIHCLQYYLLFLEISVRVFLRRLAFSMISLTSSLARLYFWNEWL